MTVPDLVTTFRHKYRRFRANDKSRIPVLLRRYYAPKAVYASLYPVRFVLSLLLAAALTVLKPLVHVRFVRLHGYSMGGFSTPMESYFCMAHLGMHPKRAIDVFYHYDYEHVNLSLVNPVKPRDAVCNRQLEEMYQRRIRIFEPARTLDNLVRLAPRIGQDFRHEPDEGDPERLFDTVPAQLEFTQEEEELGARKLEEMGVQHGSKFVCVYARDGGWIAQARPRMVSVFGDWVVHHERNSQIESYVRAAEKLTELNYYAIRVGKFVEQPMRSNNPRVIDYSSRFHSDFLDVYLAARCEFFLGQNSGISGLPVMFRKPITYVNLYPLGSLLWCTNPPNIFIPKLFYSAEKARILSIKAQVELGLVEFNSTSQRFAKITQDLGLEVWENSPEEIEEAALEMHQTLNSEFKPSPETEELQTRFSAIVRNYRGQLLLTKGREQGLRIGTQFLKTHPELLD